jgi:hypothetical protein
VLIPKPEAVPVVPAYVALGGRQYFDRHSLSAITGRSVHTIRVRCPIAFHHAGKAMYDMELCMDLLQGIATRQRAIAA